MLVTEPAPTADLVPPTRRRVRVVLPLALLVAIHLTLGCLYSTIVPLWESYDEDGHFAYLRYLAKYHNLPQPGDPEAEKIWEKFQPPLYYLLMTPLVAGFDLGETFEEPERNPYPPRASTGFNHAIHPDHPEGTARSISLAVHVARAASVLLSTVGVAAVYQAARRIWPAEWKACWAAACVFALWPQFLFTGSMVTNDALVTALSAVSFYLAIRLALDGFHLWRTLAIGVTLGAALLTKVNAFALIPVAAVAFLMSLGASRNWRSPRPWLALATLSVIVLLGLWALNSLEFVTAHILQTQTLSDFLSYASPGGLARPTFLMLALQHGLRTFVGAFGWGLPELPNWVYWVWGIGANLAIVGLTMAFAGYDRSTPFRVLVLALCQIASVFGLALSLAIAEGSPYLIWGRYLLPGLPGVAVLLISGWGALLPRGWRRYFWKGLSVGMMAMGWSIPFLVIAPAYARPQPLPASAAIDHPLMVYFGEDIQLLGYLNPPVVVPGRDFRIMLCWQAMAPVNQNYSVWLELVGPDHRVSAWLETYPGRGNYATSLWAVNVPFCDGYTLHASEALAAPSTATVRVSLLGEPANEKLPVRDAAGQRLEQEIEIPVEVEAGH